MSASARAAELVSILSLEYLPKESGYIGILGRTASPSERPNTHSSEPTLAIQSHNYYMLTAQYPVNYLHHLESNDTHILVEGGPIDYYVFHPTAPGQEAYVEKFKVGLDVADGQRPVIVVPAGCWKALVLQEGVDYALTVNVLTPEFTPDRVKIGASIDWFSGYTGKASWATKDFLLTLVGPNLVKG